MASATDVRVFLPRSTEEKLKVEFKNETQYKMEQDVSKSGLVKQLDSILGSHGMCLNGKYSREIAKNVRGMVRKVVGRTRESSLTRLKELNDWRYTLAFYREWLDSERCKSFPAVDSRCRELKNRCNELEQQVYNLLKHKISKGKTTVKWHHEVGQRQQERQKKNIKETSSQALWIAEHFGLLPETLTLRTMNNEEVSINLSDVSVRAMEFEATADDDENIYDSKSDAYMTS